METAQYGIAVFEEIDQRDFNPNISLELGYMYALVRRCLLLKDKRKPRLPTDTCGKIYRDFDTYDTDKSVSREVEAWCEEDLGLNRLKPAAISVPESSERERIVYDSASDDTLSTWGLFDTSRHFHGKIRIVETDFAGRPGTTSAFELRAVGTEFIGVNKKINVLQGAFVVEYCAILYWEFPFRYRAVNYNDFVRTLRTQRLISEELVAPATEPASVRSAWVIVTKLWHERIETDLKIKSANPRAYAMAGIVHSTGACRISLYTGSLIAIGIAFDHVWVVGYQNFGPASHGIAAAFAGLLAGALLVCSHVSYRRTDELATDLVQRVLRSALEAPSPSVTHPASAPPSPPSLPPISQVPPAAS
jgi:hypothetical protein